MYANNNLIRFHQFQAIENYLIDNNADKALLEEREKKPGGLSEPVRRFLIGHLADYLIALYGMSATKSQMMIFCRAVIVLFPSLSLKNGDDSDTVSGQ